MKSIYLDEQVVEGKRLGRHVQHDPRSRNFVARQTITPINLHTVKHRRYGVVFDQGSLGSCTGNAAAGAINTIPLHVKGRNLHEPEVVELYSLATELDTYDGQYPPVDTGSSGLAAAKAAKHKGYIASYAWAFGIDQALSALQIDPVITGVNWYEGMDTPDKDGFVKIEGEIRGGHEFEVYEYLANLEDPTQAVVGCYNSWTHNWGVGGKFYMRVADWDELLNQDGDVTVLYQ